MKQLMIIASLLLLSLSASFAEQASNEPAPSAQDTPAAATIEAQPAASPAEPADQPAQQADEDQRKLQIYMEGDKGSFKLKPGTVYHWRSTTDKTVNGKSKYYKKKLKRDFSTETPQQIAVDEEPAPAEQGSGITNSTGAGGSSDIPDDPSPVTENQDQAKPSSEGN